VEAVWKESCESKWWIGVCNFCGGPLLVRNAATTVYPHPLPQPTDKNVPDHICRDLDEAKQCFAVSAWRAAAVMARRAMLLRSAPNGVRTAFSLRVPWRVVVDRAAVAA